MPERDEIVRVAGEWIAKAENDLRAATHTLRIERECPTDTIGFHAQQCIEKYMKALWVLAAVPFPKTHDLSAISKLLPEAWRPDLSPEQMRRLTDYGTITRYPGEYEPVTLDEARTAVRCARKVRRQYRALLPPDALRRRRG